MTAPDPALAVLVANLPQGVLYEDRDRRLLLTNRAVVDLFGLLLSPEEMVGMDLDQVLGDAASGRQFSYAPALT